MWASFYSCLIYVYDLKFTYCTYCYNNLEKLKLSMLLKNVINRNGVGEESYACKQNIYANSSIRSVHKDIWILKYVNLKL